MNAYQHNQLAMGQSVSSTLETMTATSGIAALPGLAAALKTKLKLIASLAAIQALPTTGNTEDRDRVVAEAAEAALLIASPVSSYAHVHQLGDLAAKVDATASSFQRGRLADRLQLAQQIHDAAQGVLASLADFGVTQPALDDLQAKIDAASAILGTPRTLIVERSVATDKLAAAFSEVSDLINRQIDPLIASLRKSNPDAYARYQAARVVIDRPGTPIQPAPTPAAEAATPPAQERKAA